jgi:hypothetical protein
MSTSVSPRLLRSEPLRRCRLEECRAACCSYGVWVDRTLVDEIRLNIPLVSAHMEPDRCNPADWFDEDIENDEHSLSGQVIHTTVFPDPAREAGTCCVFLRADHKCALQVAGDVNSGQPWQLKPFYCIVHPLVFDEGGQITLFENPELLSEPASCLRSADQSTKLVETFEPELRYLLGDRAYEDLKNL